MGNFRKRIPIYFITFVLFFSLPPVLLPEPAWLLAQQEEGELLLVQGKQDYRDERFENAIEKFTLALRALTDEDKLLDTYLHLGLCHFALGEMEKSKENLTRLLRINPAYKPDLAYCPPDFVKLFDEAKEMIFARIKVESDPIDVKVYLDGRLVGFTPLLITGVYAAEHTLKATKSGYVTKEINLIVNEGEEKTVSIKLEKKDGEKSPQVAITPAEEKPKFSREKLWLYFVLAGAAATATVILALTKGGRKEGWDTPLGYGSLQVKSFPNGAAIFLDGQNTGCRTNYTLTDIPAGEHTIRLKLAGWKDWVASAKIYINQMTAISPCLLRPNDCFRDNFQDGDAGEWFFRAGNWTVKNEGPNYFLETEDIDAEIPIRSIQNFTLQFRLKALDFNNGNLYIHFRRGYASYYYSKDYGSYYLNINSNEVNLGKWCGNTDKSANLANTRINIGRGEWHNIEIVARGDNIRFFIDSLLILNINDHDEKITNGGIRFISSGGVRTQIDDVLITSDECIF